MNVKLSSTRPTSTVNLLSLKSVNYYSIESDSEGDKMSKFRVWVLRVYECKIFID